MKRKQYGEEKIIAILKKHEAEPRCLICRAATAWLRTRIYRWKTKLGGMDVQLSRCQLPLAWHTDYSLSWYASHTKNQTESHKSIRDRQHRIIS